MSVFAEFLLIACALFVWESTLWLPLRGIALRRRAFSSKWRVMAADRVLAMRQLGLVPMLPVPPDGGLAPCQAPPLAVDTDGHILIEQAAGRFTRMATVTWSDIHTEPHHLRVGTLATRISSPRASEVLKRAKQRGASPPAAVRQAWRLALSPARAGREWRRWRLVSWPLRWTGPVLTLGFFVGLPLIYLYQGSHQAVFFTLWLWCLMGWSAAHLWWLGKRVYPGARAPLRMDALLSLLVPFHAMRALEIAAVHAMGTTHPVGLILSTRDLTNPWLAGYIRRILHPVPGMPDDAGFCAALRPVLATALARCGKKLEDYDAAPERAGDAAAVAYCPRCHGRYLAGVTACPDCGGMSLRAFE
jgi:cytochrome c553